MQLTEADRTRITEAIRAAEGIVFNPATSGGDPVSVRKDVEYVFSIR